MPPGENPSRERILECIRAALRTPAPKPAPESSDGVIFEPVGNLLQRFQQECAANLTECVLTADATASLQAFTKIIDSLPPGEVFVQDASPLRQFIERSSYSSNRAIRWSSQGAPSEASQATVTLAEALIAQTGSIFVTSSCGGRGASVVAPCHIVFATAAQLVPDLQTALAHASRQGLLAQNSFACMISGSSRTGDIEKILVQGAHGPRRLVVIVQSGM